MSHTQTIPTRSSINPADTWDLTPLYRDLDAFEAEFSDAESQVNDLSSYRGKISLSPETLLSYLKAKDKQFLMIDRLYSYAFQTSDEDTANTQAQAMKNKTLSLYNRFFASIAWESPEILTLTPEILSDWYTKEPELTNYRHYLEDTLR